MLEMLSNHVSCFQHCNTMPIPLPSKMTTKTMLSGQYAVDHVLISSGAPPCRYSTLDFNGSSVHTYVYDYKNNITKPLEILATTKGEVSTKHKEIM